MAYWLLKSEADSNGWADLVRDGRTEWDGVRNAAAAGHLRGMKPGDSAIFYHSGKDKAAVGIATITRAAKERARVPSRDAFLATGIELLDAQLPVPGGIRLLGLTLSGIVRSDAVTEDEVQPSLPL